MWQTNDKSSALKTESFFKSLSKPEKEKILKTPKMLEELMKDIEINWVMHKI